MSDAKLKIKCLHDCKQVEVVVRDKDGFLSFPVVLWIVSVKCKCEM